MCRCIMRVLYREIVALPFFNKFSSENRYWYDASTTNMNISNRFDMRLKRRQLKFQITSIIIWKCDIPKTFTIDSEENNIVQAKKKLFIPVIYPFVDDFLYRKFIASFFGIFYFSTENLFKIILYWRIFKYFRYLGYLFQLIYNLILF